MFSVVVFIAEKKSRDNQQWQYWANVEFPTFCGFLQQENRCIPRVLFSTPVVKRNCKKTPSPAQAMHFVDFNIFRRYLLNR